jgi:undecaprenyl diphosphate synthase
MHIGIIPDGNRRWAVKNRASLNETYAIGFRNVIDITLFLCQLGFSDITFYGLTRDNYQKRSASQIETVLSYVISEMTSKIGLMLEHGIRVRFYGNLEELGTFHQVNLEKISISTTSPPELRSTLNILLNYSPDWDLSSPDGFLYTAEIPPCDLIYRSGRAKRLSGFLPFQSTFAELYFSPRFWPDVKNEDLLKTVTHFRKVKRNFGA